MKWMLAKKLAEQTAERMVSEGHAAQQEALRNLETARGQVARRSPAPRFARPGEAARGRGFFASQREAEAILAEKKGALPRAWRKPTRR